MKGMPWRPGGRARHHWGSLFFLPRLCQAVAKLCADVSETINCVCGSSELGRFYEIVFAGFLDFAFYRNRDFQDFLFTSCSTCPVSDFHFSEFRFPDFLKIVIFRFLDFRMLGFSILRDGLISGLAIFLTFANSRFGKL